MLHYINIYMTIMIPDFDLLGDDLVEIFTERNSLKKKTGSYDEKWL